MTIPYTKSCTGAHGSCTCNDNNIAQSGDFNYSYPATIKSAHLASIFAPKGEKFNDKPHFFIGLPSYTIVYKPTEMLRELEKRFVKNNVLLMNTSIWKGRKSRKPASAYVQKIKFLVWKLRLDRTSTSRNTENFKKIVHILLIQGLSIPDILYY